MQGLRGDGKDGLPIIGSIGVDEGLADDPALLRGIGLEDGVAPIAGFGIEEESSAGLKERGEGTLGIVGGGFLEEAEDFEADLSLEAGGIGSGRVRRGG